MQSVQNRDKITILILLAVSTAFVVLAGDLGGAAVQSGVAGESGRLLIASGLACGLIAVLMLLSPGKSHRSLRATLRESWPTLAGLAGLAFGYALLLPTLGFFLATSAFIASGCLLLGERRWWPLVTLCLSTAAALQLIMHGMFGIQMADPFMRVLGLAV